MTRIKLQTIWFGVILAVALILVVAAYQLRNQGRLWLCSCGYFLFWSGDAWSSDNSQHLSDPYSLTHVLHGFALCGLLAWSLPKITLPIRFGIAVAAETIWEIFENTNFVIERYREATAALGYEGDTVINSLGDILACGVGFLVARQLGLKRTLLLFLAVEGVLLLWIRDSLILNIVMLLYPLEFIRNWQTGL
jgi:hypothetical protein